MVFPINTLFLILLSSKLTYSFPDITTIAEVFKNETTNQNHFKLICSSTTAFMGCNVEILVDNKTFNDMRSVNGKCLCLQGSCSSDDFCSRFTWNFINKKEKVNHSFGCAGKIENVTLKTVYRVSSSVMFNGTNFIQNEMTVQILKDETRLKNKQRQSLLNIPLVISLSSLLLILVVCGFCVPRIISVIFHRNYRRLEVYLWSPTS